MRLQDEGKTAGVSCRMQTAAPPSTAAIAPVWHPCPSLMLSAATAMVFPTTQTQEKMHESRVSFLGAYGLFFFIFYFLLSFLSHSLQGAQAHKAPTQGHGTTNAENAWAEVLLKRTTTPRMRRREKKTRTTVEPVPRATNSFSYTFPKKEISLSDCGLHAEGVGVVRDRRVPSPWEREEEDCVCVCVFRCLCACVLVLVCVCLFRPVHGVCKFERGCCGVTHSAAGPTKTAAKALLQCGGGEVQSPPSTSTAQQHLPWPP